MKKIIKKILPLTIVTLIITITNLIPVAASDNTQTNNSNVVIIEESYTAPRYYSASSSSSGNTYYYNTGTSIPKNAAYKNKTYSLLTKVKKGDILYEAAGGFGITGHAAIVEGIFTDSKTNRKYIRIIEAIDEGVKRGILDDTRMKEKKVTILRVKNASTKQINNSVKFCISQLNKAYKLDLKKNTKSSEKNWYCSELVWAAYKNQGINIETTAKINEPGITPRDILRSDKVKKILSYK